MKRLRHALVAFFLLGLSPALHADSDHLPDTLSAKAQLSVLTCAPGTELYSVFGHSSIRVYDPNQRLDWVFNYGTFDFRTPGFLMKFIQGKLDYYLLSYSMRAFMEEYRQDLRSVREQVLLLTPAQEIALFRALKENELPENKFYKYDFFYDNCASRERDLLQKALGGNVRFKAPTGKEYGSYRSLIHPYLQPLPWTAFGIDLMLGVPTDKVAGVEGAVFLPDHLHEVLGASEVNENGTWKPLVQHDLLLYEAPPRTDAESGFFTPWLVMWLVAGFGAAISFLAFGQARWFKLFDTLLFGAVSLLGVLMLLFWIFTDHQATYTNLNLIWALPTHFFFAIGVWNRSWRPMVSRYAKYAGGLLILFFLLNWFLPQSFNAAIYPLVAVMALRMFNYWLRVQE